MAGGRVFSGGPADGNGYASTLSLLLHKPNAPSTTPGAFFLSGSSPSFLGSRSLVSFADVQGGKGGSDTDRSFFRPFVHDGEIGEDDMEEYIHQPEKKRRLTAGQLQFLEKSFESENRLEPERKIQLAKNLGLQPRQVAIWFQNRRARWKTKQLEKDYESLEASYTSLKDNYENLLKEKERLEAEVANLREKVLLREETETKKLQEPAQKCVFDLAPVVDCKQEGIISTAKSDIFDSESPHYRDGVRSSLLEHCDSSYAFEPDQSDLSQDEEDNLSRSLFPPYMFPKLEHVDDDYSDPCHFGFAEEDYALWFWSY